MLLAEVGAHGKIKGKKPIMELEIRCLNEVGLARARVNLDRFSEKRLVKNIILTEVSI